MLAVPTRPVAIIAGLATAFLTTQPLAAQAPAAGVSAQAPATPPAGAPLDPLSEMAPLPDLGLPWPTITPDARPTTGPVGAAPSDTARRYRIELAGADAIPDFQLKFNQASALKAGAAKPANAAQIDARAHDDEDLARNLLRSLGYYDGAVATIVTARPGEEATVKLTIDAGTRYTFEGVALPGLDATGAKAAALRTGFAVKQGDPVDADKVNAAVAAFRVDLTDKGYPFAKIDDPAVTVDHATHVASLSLPLAPGSIAKFGRIVVIGKNPIFSARHITDIARFDSGDPYDASELIDLRRALIQTSLVSVADVKPLATSDPGIVDIGVHLERAPPRTISGQLGYGTGEGARAELDWTHRNLISPEGAVTFGGVAGTQEQALSAILRMGNFKARDHTLTAQISAAHTNFDAYDARTFTIAAGLERQSNIIYQKHWTWSVGTEFVASSERDTVQATGDSQRRTFLVAALPASLGYDASDDLLNPTRGWRVLAHVSPEVSFQDGTRVYGKLQFDASAYQPVLGNTVLAARVRFGSIEGAPRDSIAPSRRFYAGGGGSVRGYGYQKIGPIDIFGNPVGGRGLTEAAVEARIRFGNIGIVPFLDAGNLYDSSTPGFSHLRYGAGIGARYYSSFGPIRIDIGTPIDRRTGESRIALYVSLGQAF